MADDQLIVTTKRLGNDLREFKSTLHRSYRSPSQQVTSTELKKLASDLAETWLADLSQRPEIAACVPAKYLADITVNFQRVLVFTEKATIRRRYDQEIASILQNYTTELVVPLLQSVGKVKPIKANPNEVTPKPQLLLAGKVDAEGFRATAFVGHSFAKTDMPIVVAITKVLEAIGIKVVTGQKPKADRISNKVKGLIDDQHMFVGIFTRRDRLVGKKEWSTSTWVIDEKAYASRTKKLILLKEDCVESIGGIQGDWEFIEFNRDRLSEAVISILQLFKLTVDGLM